jgi:hypothetical protein
MVLFPCILQRKWGENPPLSRNCNWEDSVIYDHWATGKIDGKTACKPGDFGILPPLEAAGHIEACNLFFKFRRRTMKKTVSSNNTHDDIYMDVLL